jgi:hypothetical protein
VRLAALLGFTTVPAAAQDRPAWFLDVEGGIGIGRSTSPRYYDFIGSGFTKNPTLGDDVLPSNVTNSNTSPAATVAAGYFLTDDLDLKGAYRYFGKYRVSGFAACSPPGAPNFVQNFEQVQISTAQGAFLGIGGTYDLIGPLYLEAAAEIGAAFIRSGGTHDANLFPQPFPEKLRTNLAGGAGGGLGYRLMPNLDLILNANYDYLGTAITGITCHCIPGTPGEHASNHLTSKMQTLVVLAGIRFRM